MTTKSGKTAKDKSEEPALLNAPASTAGSRDLKIDAEQFLWGLANLSDDFEFRGKIVDAVWIQTKDFGKGTRAQLVLSIQPTSYDGALKKAFYPVSRKPGSKWGHLQKGLEVCGLKIKNHKELIGLELDFADKTVEFGLDAEGNPIKSKVTIPVRLISQKEPNKEGSKDPSPNLSPGLAPTPASTPSPTSPIDLKALVMEAIAGSPTSIIELYKTLGAKATKASILATVKELEREGKVLFEDGIVIIGG